MRRRRAAVPGKPTARMLTFLAWARDAGNFHTWPISDSVIKGRAEQAGYIEHGEPESRAWPAFTGYRLSEKGRQVLAEAGR